jgi:D-sedoheptulose 7-phosphate isomerase
MENQNLILDQLHEAQNVLQNFVNNQSNIVNIEKAADLIVSAFKNDGKVLSCGNGGSSCDAAHFAEELTGRFRGNRIPYPAIAINDHAHITCVSNDFGYNEIFSRYIQALGKSNDVLLAISTSGNSPNILLAAQQAQKNGMKVIALTGKNGGQLAEHCDLEIRVEHLGFSDRIQEIHIKIIHIIILLIEEKMKN